MFQDKIYVPHRDQAFLYTLTSLTQYETDISLAYHHDLNSEYDTGIIYCSDPWDFITKTQCQSDPDNHSYNEAITGPHAIEYKIEMHKDIVYLIKQYIWCIITRNTLQKLTNVKSPVLPRTWASKLKRIPGGYP